MGRRTSWSTKLMPLLVAFAVVQSMAIIVEPAGDSVEKMTEESFPNVRWSAEVADSLNSGSESTLALDSQDRPHIAYYNWSSTALHYATKVGGIWEAQLLDDTDLLGESPSIAVDSSDGIHIAYSPRGLLFHIPEDPPPPEPANKGLRYAFNNGTGWKKETVPTGVWTTDTSLVLDSSDLPHISYSDCMYGKIYYAHWTGSSWKTMLVDGEGGVVSAIAVDSNGYPHIAYDRWGDHNMDLYYASWDGSSWSYENLGNASFIISSISMSMDDYDRPHIIWKSRDGFKYATYDGSWQIDVLNDAYPSMISIAVHDNTPRIYYEYYDKYYGVLQDSVWRWEYVNATVKAGIGFSTSHPLAVDSKGVPHLSAVGLVEEKARLVYLTRDPEWSGPIADAGLDQTVNEGDTVLFDGGGSYVPGNLSFEISEPIRINNVTAGDQRSMSIAKNSQGHILVAWRDGRVPGQGDIYFAKSVDEGMSFESNVKVAEDARVNYFPSEPRTAVDSEDNIYLVWRSWSESSQNTSILLSRSMDGGQTFDDPILVNEPSYAPRSIPSIAVGKNDTLHVSWHEVPGSDEQICVAKSEDRGESFGPCVVASSPTGGGANYGSHQMTSLAADKEGNVYVAWYSHHYNNVGREDIFVSRSVDGGDSFETQVKVSDWEEDTHRGNFWPTILAGPEGMVYVVWLDGRNTTPSCPVYCDVYFTRSTDYGKTFEPNVRVNDNSSELAFQYPSMALDSDGDPYVAWTTWPKSTIYIDRSIDKGETFGEDLELFVNWSDHLAHLGSVTLTDDGTLHVAWNLLEGEIQDYPHLYDVYYSHSLTSVTSGNLTYEWDFDAAVDGDSNGNSTDDMDATGSTPTWTYGDNGDFTVTLKVTDELGNWDTDTMTVTVLNVPPEVAANYTCSGGGPADIMLRIAGEKWHDVTFAVLEDGNEIYNETLVRMPGSPNEQMIGLEDFAMNGSRSYSVVAYYTPEDDPVNGQVWGATPAWIVLRSGGNETARLHHTFNVRHPQTWLWRVDDLESYLPTRECTFTAYASDPGSDDLTFEWDFGDGATAEHVYYNDGIGPDPFPSPEINPANAADEAKHSYASAGSYTVTLTVTDDDGGISQVTLVVDV